MFGIDSVELENFRSFRGKHVFKLPTAPGLYSITGINEDEPRLGANGIGKSTLLDAIYWCLFGKTTRGLRAGDVLSWGEKSCSVQLRLTVGSMTLSVRRTQAPNALLLDGLAVDQETVLRNLRLGPEAFLYAVLIPQFGESFFDLQPAAKLALFSQIMGLDYWLECSGEAQKLADELKSTKTAKEQAVAKYQGRIEGLIADKRDMNVLVAAFRAQQDGIVLKLRKELAALSENSRHTQKALKFAEDAIANIERKLAKLGNVTTICPTCKQRVEEPKAVKDHEALLRNKSDFEREIIRHGRTLAVAASDQKRLEASIQNEITRPNPHIFQARQKEAELKKFQDKLASLEAEIQQLNIDHSHVDFWVSGFKRVRLFVVEDAIQQLEIAVNNNMSSLGLVDWHVKFDVERENKSGGMTKGFSVFVYAPGMTEPVRYEAYSGGETQRLRLAGDLGLANLIMERAGLRNTVEFYDEPSRHLSQEGLNDVVETLHSRALVDSKRIFLVDHQSLDSGNFTGKFVIVKNSNGSRIMEA